MSKAGFKARAIGAVLSCGLIVSPWMAGAQDSRPPARPVQEQSVFARVNGQAITMREYESLLASTMRSRFYHGTIPEGQVEVVRREVGDLLINRRLLAEEAGRRGIKADEAKLRQTLDGYETRYKGSPMWQQNRERLLPGVKAQLEQQSVLEQLEKSVRDGKEPTAEEVRAYYEQHREKFTEPEKLRVSMILLKVDPSAPKAAWEAAQQEAEAIHAKLAAGADFAELARLHSADKSAADGGSLGYLHRGMLPAPLEGKIDEMKLGVAGEPITVLEGVAILRLEERVPPRQRKFESVAERARDLTRRDRGEAAWKALIDRLRASARIRIEASGFDKTAAATGK